jgi:flagellar biosynthesis GTPase FlhF
VTKASAKIQSSLDDFLSAPEEEAQTSASMDEFLNGSSDNQFQEELGSEMPIENFAQQLTEESSQLNIENERALNTANNNNQILGEQLKSQSYQIELLEQKLYELTEKVSAAPRGHEEPRSITGLRNSLKSLELKDKIISDILKKASFEMTREELDDSEMIYDFALREINNLLTVEMPLFSKSEMGEKQVVTILISEGASGQASMATKLGVLQDNVKIIQFRSNAQEVSQNDFTRKIFNLDVSCVSTLSHLMSEARKAISEGQSLIIDLKLNFQAADETKKFLEILRRSFENVEILTTISAINSEVYNRKVLSKYDPFTNGVIISYIDQCLNFGALVNLNTEFSNAPMKFFGTGPTVPDDIEAATSERILAAMFQL